MLIIDRGSFSFLVAEIMCSSLRRQDQRVLSLRRPLSVSVGRCVMHHRDRDHHCLVCSAAGVEMVSREHDLAAHWVDPRAAGPVAVLASLVLSPQPRYRMRQGGHLLSSLDVRPSPLRSSCDCGRIGLCHVRPSQSVLLYKDDHTSGVIRDSQCWHVVERRVELVHEISRAIRHV